ncbi:site-2 protease family protein [Asanoa siamensis]|uniref:Zinc metalloprotease n=1 Tax=Asanoa siamensis TaxID=926357 RepID=A0ABQ4CYX4_9ACTN|nr:site-2 protease family protein [Asanoa siamensis]GIF76057.1 peptidase M50 [Asanoa siamensis]
MADNASGNDRPERRPGLVVGRLWGVPLYLNPSVLLLAGLITLLYGNFVRQQLDLHPGAGYLVGFGFVVCLLASVLLHELGHAITARRFGIGVKGITLELLGGYTEMDRDAPNPRVDLLVSLAGPAVSLVLGGAAVGLTLALPDGTLWNELSFQVAFSNVVVAIFNVLPGLPLDGGRALRAVVWWFTKDRHVGTEVAGWVGRGLAVAVAVAVAALAYYDILSLFGLVFMLLIALTLWQGAGQSIRFARISRRFPLIDLARLARPVFRVHSGTPLAEAQRLALAAGWQDAPLATVDSAGRLVGLVERAAVEAVPLERRPWVSVDTVARGIDGVPTIPVGTSGDQVISTVQQNPGSQYLVTSGEDVVGVLRLSDLAQLLEPNGKTRT